MAAKGLGRGLGKGLGKGIDALIEPNLNINGSNKPENNSDDTGIGVKEVMIGKIEPDKNQPRKKFSEDELNELASSIKEHGIIQPLLVEKNKDKYVIVAGERRWRAAKIAGIKKIPIIVGEYDEKEKTEIQLIENIQRQGLNPIEEARAYRELIEDYNLKQDELAKSLGKSRTAITNTMRLLNLSDKVQEMIIEDKISQGHARALLAIGNTDEQYEIVCKIVEFKLSVRETEKLVKNYNKPKKEKTEINEAKRLIYEKMESDFREKLGTKVRINPKDEKKGRIEIEYYSQDDLEELFNKITK